MMRYASNTHGSVGFHDEYRITNIQSKENYYTKSFIGRAIAGKTAKDRTRNFSGKSNFFTSVCCTKQQKQQIDENQFSQKGEYYEGTAAD